MKWLFHCRHFIKKIFLLPKETKPTKIKKTIWLNIISFYRYTSLLYIISNVSKFAIDVSIVYLLGEAITFQHDNLFNMILLIILRFLFSIFLLGADIYMTRSQYIRFCHLSNQFFEGPYSTKEAFSKIVHDFQRIMEGEKNALELIASYLNMGIIFIALFFVDNTIAAFCFLTNLFFFPIVIWISSKRSQLFSLLNEKQKGRTQISYILGTFQKTYQFLHLKNELSNFLQHYLDDEIKIRNKDSLFRSLDIFTMAFGKVIPIVAVLLIGNAFNIKMENYAFFLFATILSLSQLIRLCRHKPLINQAKQCLNALFPLKEQTILSLPEKIVLDHTWRLCQGSLSQNIFLSHHFIKKEDSHLAYTLLSQLNLTTELQLKPDTWTTFEIDHEGHNLSLGQRLRILILRAIFIAHYTSTHKEIVIQIPIASLDNHAIKRIINVSDYIKRMHITLTVNTIPTETPSNPTPALCVHSPHLKKTTNNTPILFKNYLTFSWPGIFFIFPVTALALIGTLSISFSGHYQIIQLLSLGIGGLFSAIAIGNFIERKLRAKVTTATSTLPFNQHLSFHSFITYLTHDFQSAAQRVSWYCHDIAWLSILFFFTLLSISWEIGSSGIILFCLMGVIYFFFFKNAIPLAQKAKHQLIEAYQTFITLIENNFCMGNALCWQQAAVYATENTRNAYQMLFQSSIYQQIVTSLINSLISLSMGCLFIIIISAAHVITAERSAALATAAINIDLRIAILFSAIIGFIAEGLSLHRLLSHHGMIPSVISQEIPFKEVIFPHLQHLRGTLSQIEGPSGSGKSTYLKALAENMGPLCLYISGNWEEAIKHFNELKQWGNNTIFFEEKGLLAFISALYERNPSVDLIILDEATTNLDINELIILIGKLTDLVKHKSLVLFVVEHRISIENCLHINELIRRRTK